MVEDVYDDYYEVFVLSVIFNFLIIIVGVGIMVLFVMMKVMGLLFGIFIIIVMGIFSENLI